MGVVQAIRELAAGGIAIEIFKRSAEVVVVPADRITHLKSF
ncbi:MAG TPA: hypothetical protein VHJ82_01830 [Actinomycetota bacterium]|nr:hypothetical protein [Actinomycetota bacterium]